MMFAHDIGELEEFMHTSFFVARVVLLATVTQLPLSVNVMRVIPVFAWATSRAPLLSNTSPLALLTPLAIS